MQEVLARDSFTPALLALEPPSQSYYRARYYDAASGRFLSEDPIGINGGINFYRYVANSPVGFVDSTGEYARLDPHSRCAEVFAKAFKPNLCPEEYAKEFNDIASRLR